MANYHEIYVLARPAVDCRPAPDVIALFTYLHARPVPMTRAGRPLDETVELTKHWYLLETSRYTPPRPEQWAEWDPRPRLYGPFPDRETATTVCYEAWQAGTLAYPLMALYRHAITEPPDA